MTEDLTLQGLRERAGLSQARLAELADVSQSAISKWERGVRLDPGFNNMARVARVLGVTVEVLADALEGSQRLAATLLAEVEPEAVAS